MSDNSTKTRSRALLLSVAAAVFILPGLTGCETTTHAQQGQVIGGVLGGVLGSQVGDGSGQTAAIIIGTMAGSMIGRQIGESMDDVDRMKTAEALNSNRTGQSTTWTNPDNGRVYGNTDTHLRRAVRRPLPRFPARRDGRR